MVLAAVAREILGVNTPEEDWALPLRAGTRSLALYATRAGVSHRFQDRSERVVAKLFKGTGLSEGGFQYQEYHGNHFHRCAALTANPCIQPSLEAGRFRDEIPYAVLGFIEGRELRDVLEKQALPRPCLRGVLEDLLLGIWIPLWDAGLRFKDAHPGNFILTPGSRLRMIDTEQIRKDLRELLLTPEQWTVRDAPAEKGLRRLPGLLHKILLGAGLHPGPKERVALGLAACGVPDALGRLGRDPGAREAAVSACQKWITTQCGEI